MFPFVITDVREREVQFTGQWRPGDVSSLCIGDRGLISDIKRCWPKIQVDHSGDVSSLLGESK